MEEKGEDIHFVRNLYTFADFAYDEMASLEVWVLIDCCLVVTCLLASVHYWKSASFLEERERENSQLAQRESVGQLRQWQRPGYRGGPDWSAYLRYQEVKYVIAWIKVYAKLQNRAGVFKNGSGWDIYTYINSVCDFHLLYRYVSQDVYSLWDVPWRPSQQGYIEIRIGLRDMSFDRPCHGYLSGMLRIYTIWALLLCK